MVQASKKIAPTTWYRYGPAEFAVDALGLPPHWDEEAGEGVFDWQWEASGHLASSKKISIRSGHGVGKTAFLSWSILWFLSSYRPCKIGCTTPTGHQLFDILWPELHKWHRKLTELHPELGRKIHIGVDTCHWIDTPKEAFAAARTSRKEQPEALQGLHSDNVLAVIDEASGIPDNIFEVAEGMLTSPSSFVILTSNPTRSSGFFYNTHHKWKGEWKTYHIPSWSVPIVAPHYIDSMKVRYGEASPTYQIRVAGNFSSGYAGVIALDLAEEAVDRPIERHKNSQIVWGLDVARYGDCLTALSKRAGLVQLEKTKTWGGLNTMQVAGRVFDEYKATEEEDRPHSIIVDVIGLGAGVVDRLWELGLPAHGCNVSQLPAIREKYHRLRDELWWRCREWFESRECRLLNDEELIAELTTPTYDAGSGKIKVEGKEQMRSRGISSPDRADSFVLTFAEPEVRVPQMERPSRYKGSGVRKHSWLGA